MASIFEKTPINTDYISPTPGRITLLAGRPNLSTNGIDSELASQIKSAGCNAASAVIGVGKITDSLNTCREAGLKLFLSNGTLISTEDMITSFVNSYKNNQGLGGWFVDVQVKPAELDSPYGDSTLPEIVKTIERADSSHPIFLGLQGDWDYIGDYPSYIAEFQQKLGPSFWPYIYFPDLVKSGTTTVADERKMTFYRNLQYFAYISRYTAVPFWTFIRCQSFSGYSGYDAPYTSTSVLRGFVFASLAYGAQGIYYWDFRQHSSGEGDTLQYKYAPIDRNGKADPLVFGALKTINEEVTAYNGVFAGCDFVEAVYASKKMWPFYPSNPGFIREMRCPIGPLQNVQWSNNGTLPSVAADLDVIVTHINNGGTNYLVLVVDPFGPVSMKPSDAIRPSSPRFIMLDFNPYWEVTAIQNQDGRLQEQILTDNRFVAPASYGDYFVFRWE